VYEVRRTAAFVGWLAGLADLQARARIARRLDRLAEGNFGDAKSVGGGVSELRFAFGPGYRIYYTIRGRVVVILLFGGDKRSQARDIKRAIEMVKELSPDGR
jgi:putative addiction module killer protein